jgi:hypothetical protein
MTYFRKAAHLIGEAVGTILFFAEHGFVLTLEGLRRIAYRFDRTVYDEELRILKVEDGELSHGRNKFVVFVIYCRGPLPSFTTSAIEAFATAGYDVMAVLNQPPDASAVTYLKRWSRLIIHRANIGRDFGGYKDGISVLLARIGAPDRLIIANDSIFYLKDGLAEMMAGLDGPEDFVGASEVFDHHYHVGSYLLSFSRKAVESEAFGTFWASYKPITTRRWAILKGEGRLTNVLVKAGFAPKVLFKAEDLRTHLMVSSPEAFSELVSLLPVPTRKSFAALFEGVLGQLQANDMRSESGAVDTASPLIEAVIASNQLHTGGFLFHRFRGLPIVKRDIVFRELYEPHEVRRALSDLPAEVLAIVVEDLSTRGTGAQLDYWNRLLYRHSAI